MTKVYLLTDGMNQDDYYVVGVFSSEEKARAVITERMDGDVEEFELDALVGTTYCSRWLVGIDKESGKVFYPRNRDPYITGELVHPDRAQIESGSWDDKHSDCFIVRSPISEDHAVKAAIERRQQWLLEKESATS